MTAEVNSVISRRHDCASCKIISGCGLIGAGLYVLQASRKLERNTGKSIMATVASGKYDEIMMVLFETNFDETNYLCNCSFSGFLYVGTARLLNWPPFGATF